MPQEGGRQQRTRNRDIVEELRIHRELLVEAKRETKEVKEILTKILDVVTKKQNTSTTSSTSSSNVFFASAAASSPREMPNTQSGQSQVPSLQTSLSESDLGTEDFEELLRDSTTM